MTSKTKTWGKDSEDRPTQTIRREEDSGAYREEYWVDKGGAIFPNWSLERTTVHDPKK